MKTLLKNLSGILVLLLVGGCYLDELPASPPVQPDEAQIAVEKVSLSYQPFNTNSEVQCTVRDTNSVGASITNYEVRYSFDNVIFPIALVRLVNPTQISLNPNNGYKTSGTIGRT